MPGTKENSKRKAGWLPLSAAIAMFVAFSGSSAFGEDINVYVETYPSYTRLVFEGENPIDVDAEILNGVLLANFDRAVEFDLNIIRQEAARDVARLRQDGDGRMLRFALNRALRMQTSAADNRFAIDLISPVARTMPPPIVSDPETLRSAGLDGPSDDAEADQGPVEIRPLPVSISRHEKFSRLVFEWPERVAYEAELRDGTLGVKFDKAADPDIVELRTDPPKFIHGADKSLAGDTLSVAIRVQTGAGVRHFREGPTIVIDVLEPAAPDYSDDADPGIAPSYDNDWVVTELEPAAEPAPTSVTGDEAGNDEAGQTASENKAEQAPPDVPTDANPDFEMPKRNRPALDQYELTADDLEQSVISDGKMTAAVLQTGNNLRLIFNWREQVPAAVFNRGNTLWIVFEQDDTTLDLSQIGRPHRAFVSGVDIESRAGLQIARLELASSQLTSASYVDGAWVVSIGPGVDQSIAPFELRRAKDRNGRAMVVVPYEKAVGIHWLRDPEVGDDLAVVTGLAPIQGVISNHSLIEFNVLRSSQGLVVQALSDDVTVRLEDEIVRIGREAGLTLSQVRDLGELVAKRPLGALAEPGFIDFENWRIGESDEVYDLERQLQFDLAESEIANNEDQASNIRFGLAKLFISHAMAPEALGMLRVLGQKDETAEFNPEYRALRGIANYMQRRYPEALADLSLGALVADAHATLWRATTLTEMSRFSEAHRLFEESLSVLPRYPKQWQAYFRVQATKAALAVADLDRVKQNLDAIPSAGVSDTILAEAEIVRGRWSEQIKREGEALQHYQRALQAGTPEQQAKAQLGKIVLLHKVGQISDQEAINRLDTLRFQWRGDDLELAVLHRLGEFHVKGGDYRRGLNIMQEVVANYSDSPVAADIAGSMGGIFKGLFLDETIKDVPPVQALALYYDFKHLTPIGREGDEMIRKLVDRLVAVDLLEQAAELLEHQTNERLQGVARAQVATRLAMIYLTDHKAEMALATIRKTRQTRLPRPLAYDRQLLEARALAELGRFDHALEVVAEYDTQEVEQLRADIAWDSKNWLRAAGILEVVLGDRWKQTGAPLNDAERNRIMRAVLAYSFAGDTQSLERLRREYAPLMAKSPDASAFEIITQQVELRGVEFRRLANKIASIDTLESFMNDFQSRYDNDGDQTAIN